MEKSQQRNTMRNRIAGGALVVLGGLSLGACSSRVPNYEGIGNGYEIRGVVDVVEDDGTIRINENQLVIVTEQGRAITWFQNGDGHNVFSDDFNFEQVYHQKEGGAWGSCQMDIPVGKVFNTSGTEITPQQLQTGQVVDIQGHIRDSSAHVGKTCGYEDYSVYDVVQAQESALR